jgi:3'-phosphoadenosine 5'-phosphosulfate sulfotransferase (PAPS reductase)/FAD synthetase
MKYVVSYSGGLGSFAAAHILKQQVDPADIQLAFCDTLIEDEDLYRFLDESAAKLNLPLVKLTDGRNPWEVFRDVKYQGNTRKAQCSIFLKRVQMEKYLKTFESPPILVLGIDLEEEHRLPRAQKNNPDYKVIAPLCERGSFMTHGQRLDLLKQYNIELPRLYKMGFAHNNCGGFCVRAGLAQFAKLRENFPERFEWHKQQQKKLVEENPDLDHPFLRKTINKKQHYITLEQFEKMELEPDEKYDFGGCGCFIDDNEESTT